jgi:transcriptional regulator of nitric oxide reductase
LKKVAALAMLVCMAGALVVAAERIVTHPAEPYLKRLFPSAVAFSPFGGTPLHYTAYAVDPKTNPSAPPVGYVFWTTDVVPQEYAYHGPLHILVGMDTSGIISGAIVVYHSDPYGYFSVEPPEFAAQFKGKSIRAPFQVGVDIQAVSRASISIASGTRAIRDSARIIARQFLDPNAVKR